MPKKVKKEKKGADVHKGEHAKAHEEEVKEEGNDLSSEIAEAKAKEAEEDKARGPVQAKCEVCGYEVEVPHLRKNGCPSCRHSGLVAK